MINNIDEANITQHQRPQEGSWQHAMLETTLHRSYSDHNLHTHSNMTNLQPKIESVKVPYTALCIAHLVLQ